jgi:hypothetical protein
MIILVIVLLSSASMYAIGKGKGVEPLLIGSKQIITWNHPKTLKESVLKLHFNTKVKPIDFVVGLDTPIGLRYVVLFNKYGVYLPVDFGDNDCKKGEYEEVSDSCYIQAGEYDFDKNGIPEIVIALGDGLCNLHINIFKYHPPQNEDDAIRPENWELIGNFEAQTKAIMEDKSVIMPFGSHGFETKMTWVEGKFVCVETCPGE